MTEFYSEGTPVTGPYVVIDNFLPHDVALAMRADIDAHFGDEGNQDTDAHQVWNYWHVPRMYTYLRTRPEKVIALAKVENFIWTLQRWCLAHVGLGAVQWPHLSLYIPGCSQNLHNDALNGRFGYVYSLTNGTRQTQGGGTILMREGDPFRANLARAMTMHGVADTVAPVFNRLLLFDDRLLHAVERLEGSMDPAEGRFVLHGHVHDNGPVATGALAYDALQPAIQTALNWFSQSYGAEAARFRGPFCIGFTISPAGAIESIRVLLDRVAAIAERDAADWPGLRARYLASLQSIRFPVASGPTEVIFPIVFSGPGK